MKYVDEFLNLTCAPLLLPLFPNAKEVTESFGAFNAVRGHLPHNFQDDNITVFCVGDGHLPRTGATFACRTKWTVYSIDPLLHMKACRVARLTQINKKIEACDKFINMDHDAIIVAVHSHAPLLSSIDRLKFKSIAIIAIPCCVPQTLDKEPDLRYHDKSITSPENEVLVWKDVLKINKNGAFVAGNEKNENSS